MSEEQILYKNQIRSFLDQGYSQYKLSKHLEISRSTLLKILNDDDYSPSKRIEERIITNINWLEKQDGHESLEILMFLSIAKGNVQEYFQLITKQAEDTTGFTIDYYGMLFGSSSAFMIFHSPGIDPIDETLAEFRNKLPIKTFGKTESLAISPLERYSSSKEDVKYFLKRYPNAKRYIKLFKIYSFQDIDVLSKILQLQKMEPFKSTILCLEAGITIGSSDLFFIFYAKDERSFIDFCRGKNGMYSKLSEYRCQGQTLTIIGDDHNL